MQIHWLIKFIKKATIQINTVRGVPWYTSWTINKSFFAINEECIHHLTKSVLIPLKLTAAALAGDAGTHKKLLRSEPSGAVGTAGRNSSTSNMKQRTERNYENS